MLRAHAAVAHIPRAQQNFHRLDHLEGVSRPQRARKLMHLQHRRQEADDYAAGQQRLGCVRHNPPRLRQVKYDAVEIALFESLIHIAQLQGEIGGVGHNELYILPRAVNHILPQIVGYQRPALAYCAQQRHRNGAGAATRLQNARAGEDVAID